MESRTRGAGIRSGARGVFPLTGTNGKKSGRVCQPQAGAYKVSVFSSQVSAQPLARAASLIDKKKLLLYLSPASLELAEIAEQKINSSVNPVNPVNSVRVRTVDHRIDPIPGGYGLLRAEAATAAERDLPYRMQGLLS